MYDNVIDPQFINSTDIEQSLAIVSTFSQFNELATSQLTTYISSLCLQHGRNCLQLASLHGHIDTVLVILRTQLVGINSANKVSMQTHLLNNFRTAVHVI